jgi:signal transduction histidine kinase
MAAESARRGAAEKSDFLMNMVSHEMRTPFAVIQSSAELLQMAPTQDKEFLFSLAHNILREIDHATSILNRVVMLNRLEAEMVPEPTDPVDVESVVRKTLETAFQPWKDGRSVGLTVEGASRTVRVDPVMLDLVCRNLVDNACKYSPDRPAPLVTLVLAAESWSLSVRDFGIGIPVEEQTLLGKPYFRASNTSGIRGTGLGLSLVRYIVQRYNGRLSMHSEEGMGTLMTVAF